MKAVFRFRAVTVDVFKGMLRTLKGFLLQQSAT